MNIRVKSRLIIGIILFAVFVGNAQQATYFEHIKTDDGLSNNTINCITQDSLGNMRFGTYDGLNRYDGQVITIFKHNSKKPELSISNNKIEKLVTDGSGTVWIGLANNLIARFIAGCPDLFVHYDLSEYKSIAYNDIRIGHDGSLVVDFPNVSFRYNASSSVFETCTHNPVVNEKLQLFKSLLPQADDCTSKIPQHIELLEVQNKKLYAFNNDIPKPFRFVNPKLIYAAFLFYRVNAFFKRTVYVEKSNN